MSTYILGISAYYHDSAAALLADGEIVAAVQEERFTRVKHDHRFPEHAIDYCLSEAGIGASDLDYAVFYEKPLEKFERLAETYLAFAPEGFESFRTAIPVWVRQKLHLPREIRGALSGFGGELLFANHHESHAASAFFPSPFEEAAILTLDAVGEWGTSSIGVGRGNRIELTRELRFPHSLGMLYSAFTYYTGFRVNSGEYKLMGLAPYGVPRYVDRIREILEVQDDGSLWLDMEYFNYCQGLTMTSERFHEHFGGPPRKPESLLGQKEMDLAASIQALTEEVVLKAAAHAHELSGGLPNLVMAGGVALNCVANGRVLREGPFENLWIQPAAGDAGGALGGAYLAWHHVLERPRTPEPGDSQKGSRLGPAFSDTDIRVFLDSVGARYERLEEDELLDRVARLMDEEKVVGWFYGRMEYGPRALGSRSIIGDARSPAMQRQMNLKIKFRESFRPFAPCVLREFCHEVFDMQEGRESPYMLIVAPVREEWRVPLSEEDRRKMEDPDLRVRVSVPRSKVPAITHVDYSARVQTVDEARHGRYYRLMRRFYELTGCPVIVNTSFNIRGEPIVCTPADAYQCFMGTHIDCLVVDDYLLLKDEQPEEALVDAEKYRSQFELD